MDVIIWLIIAAILIVSEIVSLGLTTIWFAGGAIVAAVLAHFGAHWIVQILVFAIVSFVLLVLTRPIAQKHLMKDMEKTNIDGLIGITGLVTETIDNTKAEGVVVLDGKEWTARSVSGEIIEKDSKVKVDSISGVKLMVTKSE
ncbi:MAG: NfeD family protein [Lachnospiraceae bacterium]|nr:NfeD family protein [Lachnospiraceae bacterium]